MEHSKEQSPPKSGFARELTALFLLFWALFILLSLFSFDKNDPSLNQVSTAAIVQNKAGLFGAYVSGFLNEWFGLCSFLWPLFFVFLAFSCVSQRFVLNWRRWLGIFLVILCFLETGEAWGIRAGDFSPGGICGRGLYLCTSHYLHPLGASLFWLFIFMTAIELLSDFSWFSFFIRIGRSLTAKQAAPAKNTDLLDEELRQNNSFASRLSVLLSRLHTPKTKQPSMPELFEEKKKRKKTAAKQFAPEELSCDVLGKERTEALFQPPEVLFKDTTDDDDILALNSAKKTSNTLASDTGQKELQTARAQELPSKNEEKPESTANAKEESEKKTAEKAAEEEILSEQKPTPDKGDAMPDTAALAKEPEKRTPRFSLSGLFGKKDMQEKVQEKVEAEEPNVAKKGEPYPLPPLSLLTPPAPVEDTDKDDWKEKAQILMQTLGEFAIEGDLVAVTPGPVVTLFEIRPASGVRVNKFLGISDDLARVLKAPSVRIISPVPGKDTVGVEIPNDKRELVSFRELVSAKQFREAESPLTMVLGKDTAGNPIFADLAKMPHMLIAGATGTGKSVCLNSILASFLYRTQPSELKLLLIDPKRVEMSVYADEPHLIHPVVNEPSNAKNALQWATEEMDRRFKAMATLGVRNIAGYNKRLASFGSNRPEELADLEPLPYIAIIIDELADLMMMADRKDVENSIVRLAQLARACGIHMILATQRPSVNVVTGIIKANFPCRISFQVASNADSRTILNTVGAEKLLGRGDMLYMPGDTTIKRLHGAFLSDEEVTGIVSHWKKQAKPSYKVDLTRWTAESESGGQGDSFDDEDDLFNDVLDFVTSEGTASISKIQRRFKIGFNRAARLVETLEARGIIDPADGSKPRKVRR